MNDRFKRRAWDTVHKKMIYDFAIMADTGIPALLEDPATPEIAAYLTKNQDSTNGMYILIDCSNSFSDNLIQMECTGLKDENGNLVFEGDVALNGDGDVVCVEYHIDGLSAFCLRRVKDSGVSYMFESDEINVIGNIYENEELLKGDK